MPNRVATPLSVWPTGQQDPLAQLRVAGFVPGTEADVDRIPPAVAAHAIATYTLPGDLVLDPDCGAGTVLTQALRAGRHALGLTVHNRWWALARANVTAAKSAGAWRDGSVLDARPKVLATVRAAGLAGRVDLVLTALRIVSDHESAVAELATTLRCCEPLLRSGGHVVVIAGPIRRPDGSRVDLTTRLIGAGATAGLVLVDRCIALNAELRGSRLITRASIAERRAARATVLPNLLAAHHEVLVFQLAHDAELASAAVGGVDTYEVQDETAGGPRGLAA